MCRSFAATYHRAKMIVKSNNDFAMRETRYTSQSKRRSAILKLIQVGRFGSVPRWPQAFQVPFGVLRTCCYGQIRTLPSFRPHSATRGVRTETLKFNHTHLMRELSKLTMAWVDMIKEKDHRVTSMTQAVPIERNTARKKRVVNSPSR